MLLCIGQLSCTCLYVQRFCNKIVLLLLLDQYFYGSVILRQVGDITFVGDSEDIVINSASGLVKLQLRGSSVNPEKSTLADCPVIFPGTGTLRNREYSVETITQLWQHVLPSHTQVTMLRIAFTTVVLTYLSSHSHIPPLLLCLFRSLPDQSLNYVYNIHRNVGAGCFLITKRKLTSSGRQSMAHIITHSLNVLTTQVGCRKLTP